MDLLVAKRALGLLSIALGVVAVANPVRVSRSLGLTLDEQAMSAFGAREIAAGAGLLSPVKPGPWFWVRVGGDVMDMATLAKAIDRENPRRTAAFAALAAVAAIAALDLFFAARASLDKEENAEAAA
ncbi:MAG: hypothetical protein ACK41C_05945 [Phenylobacterium sp.]|jgi:hypothetical protein|uniref:hypothetical protein n=1 Tax=Phenylobacterium sp. TaxID=1871053 RepID=UPI00391A3613